MQSDQTNMESVPQTGRAFSAAKCLVFLLLGAAGDSPENIEQGERNVRSMKQKGSVKRLVILALAVLGLVIYTGFYVYMWQHYFYHQIAWKTQNPFYRNGHLLVIGIYFVLLFFFSNITLFDQKKHQLHTFPFCIKTAV